MQKLRIVLASLVTTVWLAGYIVSWVKATGNAPTELTGLMVFVLGWAFTGQAKDVVRRLISTISEESSPPPPPKPEPEPEES